MTIVSHGSNCQCRGHVTYRALQAEARKINQSHAKVASRESKTANFRKAPSSKVLFSVHMPTIRKRREMKLIHGDIYADHTPRDNKATEMNATFRHFKQGIVTPISRTPENRRRTHTNFDINEHMRKKWGLTKSNPSNLSDKLEFEPDIDLSCATHPHDKRITNTDYHSSTNTLG